MSTLPLSSRAYGPWESRRNTQVVLTWVILLEELNLWNVDHGGRKKSWKNFTVEIIMYNQWLNMISISFIPVYFNRFYRSCITILYERENLENSSLQTEVMLQWSVHRAILVTTATIVPQVWLVTTVTPALTDGFLRPVIRSVMDSAAVTMMNVRVVSRMVSGREHFKLALRSVVRRALIWLQVGIHSVGKQQLTQVLKFS